mmetsp:Transcript_10606/g.33411  ORF Transcript_10606/g.33411 Transcript_10606/m.33411 type:complete len:200 (+) Transcript_10606:665-1264(+)
MRRDRRAGPARQPHEVEDGGHPLPAVAPGWFTPGGRLCRKAAHRQCSPDAALHPGERGGCPGRAHLRTAEGGARRLPLPVRRGPPADLLLGDQPQGLAARAPGRPHAPQVPGPRERRSDGLPRRPPALLHDGGLRSGLGPRRLRISGAPPGGEGGARQRGFAHSSRSAGAADGPVRGHVAHAHLRLLAPCAPRAHLPSW